MAKLIEKKDSGQQEAVRREKNFPNFVKYESKSYTIPLIMFVLGLLFVLIQGNVLDVIVTILGVVLMIGGVVMGISLMSNFSPLTVFVASMLFIMGIICVANPGWVAGFFLKVVGLCILLNALIRIVTEHSLKGKSEKYNFYLMIDVVSLVIGLLLFLFPKAWLDGVSWLFIVFGVILIILGVFNLYSAFKVYKEGRYVNDGTDVVWEE
ncbi:MAG: DUF308 domain-containing protein [Eubacterium sp.]|nr:DUF308 domain-containing protein [Eubacterium sp.]